MKRIKVLIVLVLCFVLFTGCKLGTKKNESLQEDEALKEVVSKEDSQPTNEMDDYEKYKGTWKLKVSEDEELYLMTTLEIYFGVTGISIDEINNSSFKGSIYSVQGAPSYRQANVPLEGEVKDGKLEASYEDEGWLYSGDIKMTLEDEQIEANISRDEVDIAPMWGIPEGKFNFVRPIDTEVVNMLDEEKNALEQFLLPVSRQGIQPFLQNDLTDEMIINFVGINLAIGYLDISEFGDSIIEQDAEVVFDKTVMNALANKYFGVDIKKHQSNEMVTYEDGFYKVPALGGVTEYPVIQIMLKDTNNTDIYYAIVDYMFDSPEEAATLEYEYLIKLEKKDNYIIKEIKEIKSPINFEILHQLLSL